LLAFPFDRSPSSNDSPSCRTGMRTRNSRLTTRALRPLRTRSHRHTVQAGRAAAHGRRARPASPRARADTRTLPGYLAGLENGQVPCHYRPAPRPIRSSSQTQGGAPAASARTVTVEDRRPLRVPPSTRDRVRARARDQEHVQDWTHDLSTLPETTTVMPAEAPRAGLSARHVEVRDDRASTWIADADTRTSNLGDRRLLHFYSNARRAGAFSVGGLASPTSRHSQGLTPAPVLKPSRNRHRAKGKT